MSNENVEKIIKMKSASVIMKAKEKPEGCSDVRWRIELRRRARRQSLGRLYGEYGEAVI